MLAMEYLRQLEALGHPMQQLAVPRLGAGHDGAPAGGYASASYLRRHPEMWEQYLPPAVLDTARREQAETVLAPWLDRGGFHFRGVPG